MITTAVTFHPEAVAEAQRMLAKAGASVQPHRATIGIHEDEGSKPKVDYASADQVSTLAEVMIQHEFGGDVPERSFLRHWFDANERRLAAEMYKAMQQEMRGNKSAVKWWVQNTHKEWLKWIASGGDFTGLTPQTIAAKSLAGMSQPTTPLVATMQFIDSWRAKLDDVAVAGGDTAAASSPVSFTPPSSGGSGKSRPPSSRRGRRNKFGPKHERRDDEGGY